MLIVQKHLKTYKGRQFELPITYLIKHPIKKIKKKTLYEFWKGKRPFYKHLKMWGYLTKVVIHDPKNIRI